MEELELKFTRDELNLIYDLVRNQSKQDNNLNNKELLQQIISKMDKFYMSEFFKEK